MNILLVAGPGISLKEPYNSGIEAFMVSFAAELIEQGHTVDVVAKEANADARFGLIDPFASSTNDKSDFFLCQQEKLQFGNLDVTSYDVIHYNMFYPHLLEAGLCFDKPVFLTLHSPADERRVSVYKKFSQQSNITFIAISDRIKQQWDEALVRDIPLINNGINLHRWPLKTAKGGGYLLWSARINKQKNATAAISVANEMQLRLIIAGRITDQHYFDQEVKPHLNSQIQYVGHVTQQELSELAQRAVAYLATAIWQEPFGLAALEMLASGVPVVGFTTAVPPNWKHESVFTTASLNWQDLVELVEKSEVIGPDVCSAFASTMSIQYMTSNYIRLYKETMLQKSLAEKVLFADDSVLQRPTQQPQILE